MFYSRLHFTSLAFIHFLLYSLAFLPPSISLFFPRRGTSLIALLHLTSLYFSLFILTYVAVFLYHSFPFFITPIPLMSFRRFYPLFFDQCFLNLNFRSLFFIFLTFTSSIFMAISFSPFLYSLFFIATYLISLFHNWLYCLTLSFYLAILQESLPHPDGKFLF